MSMDDVYTRAQELSRGLEQFNDHLRATMAEVERAHGHVSPMWDDTGPQYMDFLIQRLTHLNSYLHGHGS